MKDDLSKLSAAEIDALPFGYIALAPDGTIRKYNRYEADLARKDPQEVLGRNFFREVAPCTQVQEFEGRFRDFVEKRVEEPTLSFDFQFAFRHGTQRVRIGMVRSSLEREVIVTVNRVRELDLPLDAQLRHEAGEGLLFDVNHQSVITTGTDFWHALEEMVSGRPEAERRAALHLLGKRWGQRHALRVEGFVQRRHALTLREVELQVALETLSGSLGVLGLGRFDVDLHLRRRGLVMVRHHGSPLATLGDALDGPRCAILAGLHAGFLSYVSGRDLVAREIDCSASAMTPCRFLVGTERRLEHLFEAAPGSADADLLLSLELRPGGHDHSGDETGKGGAHG